MQALPLGVRWNSNKYLQEECFCIKYKANEKKNKAAYSTTHMFGLSDQTLACSIHGLQYFVLWVLKLNPT